MIKEALQNWFILLTKQLLAVLAFYVIHHLHKLTKFEIDQPSGSQEK